MKRASDTPPEPGQEATVSSRPLRRSGPPGSQDSESGASRVSRHARGAVQSGSIERDAADGPEGRSARRQVAAAALNEVMLGEEATRANGFASVVAPLAAGIALTLPLLGGDPVAKWVCIGALVVMSVASALLARVTAPNGGHLRFDRRVHRAYGWLLLLGVFCAEYYFGFFSPIGVILVFGAYYFGQSLDRVQSLLLPGMVIVTYSAGAALTAAGVLRDRGLFTAREASLGSELFAILAVATVLIATLRVARVSRAALREAIARSNEAVLVAQQREAQLAEAHFQLDHALALGVGKPGRYTGEVAGAFELGEVIGIGAVGEVYRGLHRSDGTQAAVKLLQAGALVREDLVERILRESTITSTLDNPHLVKVLGAGRLRDGAPYFAMELLRGRDLAARLRQEGQLSLPDLALLAKQVGNGLHHAHLAGVVHRDLKPLNIFEAEQHDGTRCWKILDFGISKVASSSGTLTQEGVVGTPGYMSPEQARGAEVGPRSDVFSMAVVLYRAMTGQPAFPGENTPQIMFDIVYKMPSQPSKVRRGLPPQLDLVMALGMAKDAEQRFATTEALAAAAVAAIDGALSPELCERGSTLSRRFPWGSVLAARSPQA